MYYVYVLRSQKSGRLYKGYTKDIKRRFSEHNNLRVTSTKAHAPWMLIYYEAFVNKTDARREELFLKSGKGKERIKFLLQSIFGSKD